MVRTLIVEDDDALRRLLRLVFCKEAGFEVVGEARNGVEGIQLAADLEPELVLLDLMMPVMDGFAALPEIRRALPGSAIVVLSMLEADRVAQKVIQLGANAFIDKGVRTNALVARVQKVLADVAVQRRA